MGGGVRTSFADLAPVVTTKLFFFFFKREDET